MAASKNPKKGKKAKTTQQAKTKRPSALDAAARVLGESKGPMTCAELIQAMASKGYWSSPKGKTPAATLYSALLREINTKGSKSRFKKTERGKFGLA
jgi:HB1, ASXL, restriction endonuclease HTH domain